MKDTHAWINSGHKVFRFLYHFLGDNMYYYYLYGIFVKSEVKLYNLDIIPEHEHDLFVHYGELSEEIIKSRNDGITSVMSQNQAWFTNDVGVFVIDNGNEITVSTSREATDDEVASFVLGWGMAFLFQQRGIPAIHSSALIKNGNVFLISGVSGAGKSTIALELINRGFKYICDDIAMVDYKRGMIVEPAFPLQKVCRNVAENIDDKGLLTYINEKKDKFSYRNEDDFCNEPGVLKKIFFLRKDTCEEVQVKKLVGMNLWNGVANSLFLLDAYRALGFPYVEKVRCLEIAGKIEAYQIVRPDGKNTVDEICKIITDLMEE